MMSNIQLTQMKVITFQFTTSFYASLLEQMIVELYPISCTALNLAIPI